MDNKQTETKERQEQSSGTDEKRRHIRNLLIAGALTYIPAAGALTAKDWIIGARQNSKCRNISGGQARLARGDVRECEIYSAAETAENPSLRDVRLYFLPGESTETKPYILYLPGGAYLECDSGKVALPSAAEANALGYSAFVLRYRIRRHSADYGPLDDLAAAIGYITRHAKEFNVCPEGYMLTGFSAGGNLAGLFASRELGYARYGLPKPAALTLLYPWSNINARIRPTGNVFTDGYKLLGRTLAVNVLLGFPVRHSVREGVCVHNRLDADYPPCFIAQGGRDFLAPKEINAELLVKRLKELGIAYEYRVFPTLTHGFGIGHGTEAEGWVAESLRFWQKQRECRS